MNLWNVKLYPPDTKDFSIMRNLFQTRTYVILLLVNVLTVILVFAVVGLYNLNYYRNEIDFRFEGDWPMIGDEIIGFSAARNAETIWNHLNKGLSFHVITDSRGARRSSSSQDTENEVDIMTVGGSFSWGHGLENEQTFSDILGRRLDVNVINLAFPSYGTVQALKTIEENADLKPKVIIYGFIKDHIRRNLQPCANSYMPSCLPTTFVDFDEQGNAFIQDPLTEYSEETGRERYEIVSRESYRLKDILWGIGTIVSKLKRKYLLNPSNDYEYRKKSIRYLMNLMIEKAETMNAVLIVMHIPYLHNEYINPPPLELMISLSPNIVFIDLTPTVNQYYSVPNNPSLNLKDDTHPNSIANELIADEIYKVLKSRNIF